MTAEREREFVSSYRRVSWAKNSQQKIREITSIKVELNLCWRRHCVIVTSGTVCWKKAVEGRRPEIKMFSPSRETLQDLHYTFTISYQLKAKFNIWKIITQTSYHMVIFFSLYIYIHRYMTKNTHYHTLRTRLKRNRMCHNLSVTKTPLHQNHFSFFSLSLILNFCLLSQTLLFKKVEKNEVEVQNRQVNNTTLRTNTRCP